MDILNTIFFKNKIEMSAHALPGTRVLTRTDTGPIYRMPLNYSKQKFHIKVPDEIEALLIPDRRDKLISDLNWNKFDSDLAIGRPSSAFLVHLQEGLFIDFIEIKKIVRGRRQPHDFIRNNVNYDSALQIPINPLAKFLSGHIAPLTISTNSVAIIFMLDAFYGTQPNISHPDIAGIMAILRGNRILPITSDGYII